MISPPEAQTGVLTDLEDQRGMVCPSSEIELLSAKIGDEVKIGHSEQQGLKSSWSVLHRREGIRYIFIEQEDTNGVRVNNCPLDKVQYDERHGAILNHSFNDITFIGPRDGQRYEAMVSELKEAGLWKE